MGNSLARLPDYFFEGGALLEKITSGLHCCYLSDPIHLEYVSDSFCEMLGYTRKDIHELFNDKYTCMCYPSDVGIFMENITYLAKKEDKRTFEYRMVKKDGNVIRVRDSMASSIMNDGVMRGYSVIEDISEEVSADKNLRHLTHSYSDFDSVPYGTMEFVMDTDSGYPKILNCNSYMRSILGVSATDNDWMNTVDDTLQFILPWEDRSAILSYLRSAVVGGPALKVEHTIMCNMSHAVEISGWVRKERDSSGTERFFAVYLENSKLKRDHADRITLLLEALSEIYDEIIELDFGNNTVKIISTNMLPFSTGIRYNLTDATREMIEHYLDFSFREGAYKNLDKLRKGIIEPTATKTHFEFLSMSGDTTGTHNKYLARVIPLSASRYLTLAKKEPADVNKLSYGHTVIPVQGNMETQDADMLNTVPQTGIYARTFGHFDLFVNGEAVYFKSAKAKELMALLIERRGGYIEPSEAVSYLWENEALTKTVRARYRKTVLRLKESLSEYNIEHILIKNGVSRKVDISLIRSDLTDYLSGDERFAHLYKGYYMYNYSWGEVTCSELEKLAEYRLRAMKNTM